MVLVDTSVWINHFRSDDRHLAQLLYDGDVVCHPYIIGELACGNLKNRKEIISLLQSIPSSPVCEFGEILFFIEQKKLNGKGVVFVAVNLLASAQLGKFSLWTADKRLQAVARELGLNYKKKK